MAPRGGAGQSDSQGPRYDPNDEYMGLPQTEGVDTVFSNCTYCHSAAIIMQQRMPPSQWDYTLNWMVEKQGMPELEPEDRKVVMNYLIQHFSTESGKSGEEAK